MHLRATRVLGALALASMLFARVAAGQAERPQPFESLQWELIPADSLTGANGVASGRSYRPVLWGAVVGAGLGLLAGGLGYEWCRTYEGASDRDCEGTWLLVFGLSTAAGAMVGLVLSGDPP